MTMGAPPGPGRARYELLRALGAVADSPAAAAAACQALGLADPGPAGHTEAFVLNCPPYAAVCLGESGGLGGEAADRVAGLWRAIGLAPPSEPDHLAVLLSLYASLGESASRAGRPATAGALNSARRALFHEHVWPWLPAYLDAVAELGIPSLAAWADLTTRAAQAEHAALAAGTAGRPANPLPLALRSAPPPLAAGFELEDLLTALTVPVRSGFILTRRQLAAGAMAAGVGYRIGERRFSLRAMLEQAPAETLGWLAAAARRWQRRHAARAAADPVQGWWAERARHTARALTAAASLAQGAGGGRVHPSFRLASAQTLARWTWRRLLPHSRQVSYSQPGRGTQADDVAGAFADTASVRAGLAAQGYLADDKIAGVVSLAARLGKPLLIEGPAGTGKTQLAKSVALLAARPLIRLQCYEGIDESKALYEWDYRKQLLWIQAARGDETFSADAVIEDGKGIFDERFLLPRPMLEAIRSPEPAVLLVDEVDRVDAETEALFLEVLAEYQVSVPELGRLTARHLPLVFLTSNGTRDLSEALKRRCLFLYLDYPAPRREREIVAQAVPGLAQALVDRLVALVETLRRLNLKKPPSIAETIDLARALHLLGATDLDLADSSLTLNVLLKYRDDVQIADAALARRPWQPRP